MKNVFVGLLLTLSAGVALVGCANPTASATGGNSSGNTAKVAAGSATLSSGDDSMDVQFSFDVPTESSRSAGENSVELTGTLVANGTLGKMRFDLVGTFDTATGLFYLSSVGTLSTLTLAVSVTGTYLSASFSNTSVSLAVGTTGSTDATLVYSSTAVSSTSSAAVTQAASSADTVTSTDETSMTSDVLGPWRGTQFLSYASDGTLESSQSIDSALVIRADGTFSFWQRGQSAPQDSSVVRLSSVALSTDASGASVVGQRAVADAGSGSYWGLGLEFHSGNFKTLYLVLYADASGSTTFSTTEAAEGATFRRDVFVLASQVGFYSYNSTWGVIEESLETWSDLDIYQDPDGTPSLAITADLGLSKDSGSLRMILGSNSYAVVKKSYATESLDFTDGEDTDCYLSAYQTFVVYDSSEAKYARVRFKIKHTDSVTKLKFYMYSSNLASISTTWFSSLSEASATRYKAYSATVTVN